MLQLVKNTLHRTFRGDLSLNVLEHPGEGDPVVFLHGLGGTTRYWTCMLDEMPVGRRALFIDLLGFGESSQPWRRYTVDLHLAALDAQLQAAGPVTLVGHSLGAALALMYAARYPHRVKSLILISLPYFGSRDRAFRWLRRTPQGWLFTNMLVAGLACMITRRLARKLLVHFLTEYPREVTEDIVKHNVMSSVTSLWNVLYHYDLYDDARRLPAALPVLCIHARDDDTAPYETILDLTKRLPHWQLSTLSGSRHHPWLWDYDRCRQAMDSFLSLSSGDESKASGTGQPP